MLIKKRGLSAKGVINRSFCAVGLYGLCAFSQAELKIEEVVVTAQKRAESVQDVPIAMSVLNADALREMGVTSSEKLAEFVPNLEWVDDGSNVPNIFIRGIGDISFHLNQVGGVGLYMDEVSLNSPVLAGFTLFDMERVEVLRGPQNTLFGRNTTGGAVQFISRKPDIDGGTNGHLNFNYGNLGKLEVEGALGFDLSDQAAVRIALTATDQDDWLDNITLGNEQGGYDSFAGRAQLLWQPSEDVEILFNVHGGERDGDRHQDLTYGGRDPANPSVNCPGSPDVGAGCVDARGFQHPNGYDETASNIVGEDNSEAAGAFVSISIDFPAFTLTSVTAFDHSESEQFQDSDGGPETLFYFSQASDVDQWSQELRFASSGEGGMRWIGGLYYFFEDAEWATALRFAPGPTPFQIVPNNVTQQDNEVWSAYGQLEFDLSEQLTVTAGLRYTNETKEASVGGSVGRWTPAILPADVMIGFNEISLLSQQPGAFSLPSAEVDETWEEIGGKVSLDYRYSEDMLFYASVARGFKGGGTSLAAIESLVGQPGRTVDPEYLWAYEIGAKTSWLDGALQLNGSLFYNQWEDQQLFTTFVVSGITSTFLVNVPESTSQGAELELQWIPAEGWFVAGGVTLLDAEVDDAGSELPDIEEGNALPNSPEMTLNGLIRKEWTLNNGTASLQTSVSFKDEVNYDISENPVLEEDSYWLVNVRAGYRFGPEEAYEVALWGENLSSTGYCKMRSDLVANSNFGGVGRCVGNEGQAIYGVSASIRFD